MTHLEYQSEMIKNISDMISKEIYKYDAKIIKKYNFDIYLEESLFHSNPVKNLINIPMTQLFTYCGCGKCYSAYQVLGGGSLYNKYSRNPDPTGKHIGIPISYQCKTSCYDSGNTPRSIVIKKIETRQPNIKISLYLDVNLNIIIPEIKTIIINNYAPFSIYSLYSIQHIINKSNNIILNQYSTDSQLFNDIEKVKKACDKYISSVHQRDLFNDGILFSHILNFFEYDNIIKNIKPHLLFQNAIKLDKSHEIEVKYKQQIAELIEDYENKIKIITQERDDIYKKYALEVNLIKFTDMVDNSTENDNNHLLVD
jgi:hypothetical protein